MQHELETLAGPAAVAAAGATFVAELARAAVESDGSFRFAVSGGHTPWAMFGHKRRPGRGHRGGAVQRLELVPHAAAYCFLSA